MSFSIKTGAQAVATGARAVAKGTGVLLDFLDNASVKLRPLSHIPLIGDTIGDEQPNADDGQVPELPEPERGFGVQVVRVNINMITSKMRKSAAAEDFCGGAGWLFFCLRLRRL